MHAVVMGAGLLGLSTAHTLRQDGHTVHVVEARPGPGLGTSLANAGLICPSLSEPWNAPGLFWKMLHWIGREDAPFLLRAKALPSLMGWGNRFFWQSTSGRVERNSEHNLRLALHSLKLLYEWKQDFDLEFDDERIGILKIFRSREEVRDARKQVDFLTRHDVEAHLLSSEEAVALEPALEGSAPGLAGAIHHAPDAHGDAHLFCCGLEQTLRSRGVQFDYDTRVTGWVRTGQKIAALETESRLIEADLFVLAAGTQSVELAQMLGIKIPVRPAKGYSITLELSSQSERPRMPVIDESLRVALTPLGQRLRVAGTAEFAGYDTHLSESRIKNLLDMLESIYPLCAKTVQPESMSPWCGLRPVSADGVPVIGPTALANFFLNTGHGPLGWTLAAGSARMLADVISGRRPQLDPKPYALDRFRLRNFF